MSLDDLSEEVWQQLSARKHLAGRVVVRRIVGRVVRKWPHAIFQHSSQEGQEIVMRELSRSVDRMERHNVQMGVLLTLILSALVSEIVKAIFAWWRKSASNRAILVGFQQEMKA